LSKDSAITSWFAPDVSCFNVKVCWWLASPPSVHAAHVFIIFGDHIGAGEVDEPTYDADFALTSVVQTN